MDDQQGRAPFVGQLMGGVQPFGDFEDDSDRERRGHGLAFFLDLIDEGAERISLHPLHGLEQDAILLGQVEHLHHVRMDDARGESSFVQKHLPEALLLGVLGQDGLDGDVAFEAMVSEQSRRPDGPHAALRNDAKQLVSTEHVPWF